MKLYQCPICSQPLALTERTWKCVNNHCFDVAKEGYVNLLPVNKKRSKEPGDSKSMLQSRRCFLDQGYYQPLADTLVELLQENVVPGGRVLDLGCGEGYYLEYICRVANSHNQWNFAALDIAKPGVQMTAKRLKARASDIECSVASAVDTPYINASFDAVYSVFAPFNDSEISRILKSDGHFILVGPGPSHLNELSEVIYDTVKPHEGNVKEIANSQHLNLDSKKSVRTTVSIPQPHIPELLAMTPYFWSTSEAQKQKLFAMKALKVTLEFDVQVYVRKNQKLEK